MKYQIKKSKGVIYYSSYSTKTKQRGPAWALLPCLWQISLVWNNGISAFLALIWKRMGFPLEWNKNFCSYQKIPCGTKKLLVTEVY